jgi:hypothetical protein
VYFLVQRRKELDAVFIEVVMTVPKTKFGFTGSQGSPGVQGILSKYIKVQSGIYMILDSDIKDWLETQDTSLWKNNKGMYIMKPELEQWFLLRWS